MEEQTERTEHLQPAPTSLLKEALQPWLPNVGGVLSETRDEVCAVIENRSPQSYEFFKNLRDHPTLLFSLLVDITVIDWLDSRSARFEVVYHLLSLEHGFRLRVKIPVAEGAEQVDSVVPLWDGANFMERETWDMYGVTFAGHPDLRRILLYDEFKGHPLRKDYPVQLKQPRIAMRHPEVENTARRMHRPDLVAITPRKATSHT